MWNLLKATICAATVLGFIAGEAMAIPAFARKYHTSCQTCHIAYPKLNNFGNAFRLLGYRLPGETEAQIKTPPVNLGAPAYKRVWPKSVWPSTIPAHIPIAFNSTWLVENSSVLEEDDGEVEREIVHNDFRFPEEFEIITAGNAGEHIAWFGELEIEREVEDHERSTEIGIGHVDMRFVRPIKDSVAFNVKLGSFQPEMVATFDHARRLTVANYDSMFSVSTISPGGATAVGGGGGHHGGGGGLALPAVAEGVELYGVAWKRFLWSTSVASGLGPGHDTFDGNSSKDVLARVGYKFGGLAPDGSNAETYAASDKNWQETSLQVGIFGYRGYGDDMIFEFMEEDIDPNGAPIMVTEFADDEDFRRYGIDFNLFYRNINVFGAYVTGKDEIRVFEEDPNNPGEPGLFEAEESGEFEYDAWFVEVDAVLGWPWLHGAVRYETVDLPGEHDGEPAEDWKRATVHLTGLVRANSKAILEYTWDVNESKNYSIWTGWGLAF